MSTHWRVHCVTCDDSCPSPEQNHGEDLMRDLIEHRHAIAGLSPLLGQIDLGIGVGSRIDVDWFVQHAGHELAPRNEYGLVKLQRECRRCQQPQEQVFLLTIINGGAMSRDYALCEPCQREVLECLYKKKP